MLVSAMTSAQKNKPKGNSIKDITITACKQLMPNGMYRISFGYNNPNATVVTVDEANSFVVFKKKVMGSNGKEDSFFALNTFQPGKVENAFFADVMNKEWLQWTLTNPSGKKSKIKADYKSPTCVVPPIIVPVYGQEGGKSVTKLGLELTALAEGNAGDEPSKIVYQIKGTGDAREVLLEIVPIAGRESALRNTLQTTYDRQYLLNDPLNTDFIVDPQSVIDGNLAAFDVFFPINQLLVLNDDPDINFIRPLYTPIRNAGVALTQGDAAMFTNAVRESFVLTRDEDGTPLTFVNGEGEKIGVISDSYDKQLFTGDSNATLDVSAGDLPGLDNPNGYLNPVTVVKDYPYGVASDEGRAMLQLIHDVAPAAELAFSTGVLSPRDFALAIDDLANAGCDLIVDDVTYPFEPFFGEGQISEAIKNFTNGEGNEGHAYFTSAGNFANRGYQGVFQASTNSPVTNIDALDTAKAHVFSSPGAPEDILQGITVVPGTYMIVLQWAEPLASQNNSTGATTDLDIFLVDNLGNFIVGNNRVNINGDAAEVLVFQATGTGTANIMITSPASPTNPNGPGPVPFRYIAFRTSSDAGTTGLQFTEYNGGAPTVSGHAMTPEAITVGAVDWRIASSPVAEAFSSFAGALTNTPAQLLQVDLAAPDGGNTTVQSIGNDIATDPDTFPNFFGTSAAAPHAAAAFALMKSAISTWYPEGGLPIEVGVTTNEEADQILQLFKSTAIPTGSIVTAGSGLINAQAAFQQIAAQTAVITGFNILLDEGEAPPIPGVDTYDITISGNYIPAGATVLLGDEELDILGTPTATEITATVVPFSGNPQLTVVNNSELPGAGKSNGLPILPDGKLVLNIIAQDLTVEFGDALQFTYKVQGLPGYEEVLFGLPEGETLNSALAELGLQLLPQVVVESNATGEFPDARFYLIAPGFGDVALTQAQLDAYQINLINGTLTIERRNLIVKPENVSIVYGEAVSVILNYLGEDEEPLDSALELAIRAAHTADFYKDDNSETEDNTFLVINKLRAVVNAEDILGLLNAGSSWMASDKVIQNKLRAVVNGDMNLIDLDGKNFDNYFDITEPIGNKLRAVVNKLRAVVNGQDLLNGNMQLQLIPENAEEEAIPNKLRAVVNGTSLLNQVGDTEFGAYDKIFAVVDFEDGNPADENGDPIDPEDPSFNQVYATNLLSSLDVTNTEEPSKVYPGAILSNLGINFNTQYRSANLTVSPANLFVQTPNLEVDFGVGITRAFINSLISPVPVEEGCEVCPEASLFFEGFVYGETVETVFADPDCTVEDEVCPIVIPYYFEDIETGDEYYINDGGEEGLMLPAGDYFIKIENPQNYILEFGEGIGRLKVINREFTVSGNYDGDYTVEYGDFVYPEDISPFVKIYKTIDDDVLVELDEGELEELFPSGIQYYLVDEELDGTEGEVRYFLNDEEPPLLPVGSYIVKISLTDESNYTLRYVDPLIVRVDNKVLIVNSAYFDNDGGPYGIDYGQTISTAEWQSFLDENIIIEGNEDEVVDILNVFPEGVPYYLVDVDLEGTEVEERYFLGDINDEDYLELPAGLYVVRVEMPESNYDIEYGNFLLRVNVRKIELIFNADSFDLEYGEEVFEEEIQKFNNPTESLISVFQGFAYEDNEFDLFEEAIPYVFVPIEGEGEIPLGGRLVVGDYLIRIASGAAEDLQNYEITYDDGEEGENNVLTITKAELSACIDPEIPEIRAGDLITPAFLNTYFIINGYLYDDDQNNVFPGGVISYVLVEAGDETIIPTEGITLGEGIYTIRISDDELDNYTVSGLACKSTVEVTACGDALVLDFSNYIVEEDGYRYDNVAPGSGRDLDAVVTVQSQFNVGSFTIDQNTFPVGSDDRKQFRPSASFNITNAFPEPYLEFRIVLVDGATGLPASEVGKLIANVLDVDGESAFQEYVEVTLPLEYTVDGATQIAVETTDDALLRINGYDNSYVADFNAASTVNVEVVYENETTFLYRVGAKRNVSGNYTVPTRQYGIQFSCLNNYNNPQTFPVAPFAGFAANSDPDGECVIYNNPVSADDDYMLYLQPVDGVSGAADITLTNMNTLQTVGYSFADGEQIIIDMGSLPAAMYIVQTNIGTCQNEGFIIVKE
jgi:hypothetical protein